jgi:hypothetical protein
MGKIRTRSLLNNRKTIFNSKKNEAKQSIHDFPLNPLGAKPRGIHLNFNENNLLTKRFWFRVDYPS